MNYPRAIKTAVSVWGIGVLLFLVAAFLPLTNDPELQANITLAIAFIPLGWLGAKYYCKQGATSAGYQLALVMALVAALLDALITVPVFLPIIKAHGFDPLWFGILFVINMEIGYMTPPFGYNLFLMRAMAPPEITLKDIYTSILPFVLVMVVALATIMAFPEIALWLPGYVYGN